MKIAVTGASGFLGRHVIRALQGYDVDIVAICRHAPQPPFESDLRANVTLWDIKSAEGAFDAMGRPDLLLHLAWDGLPNYQAERHVDDELPAQARFLLGCMDDGLQRLAVAGTCFEYGLTEGELAEEGTTAPVTRYGQAKQRLFELVQRHADRRGTELDWARFFYLYGEGQGPASLYTQLMRALTDGSTQFNMSPGDQRRDFLPVEEAARLFVEIALAPAGAGAVNICSGNATTVNALVDGWIAEHGGSLTLNRGHYPYPAFEPHAFWGRRERLDAILKRSALHTAR